MKAGVVIKTFRRPAECAALVYDVRYGGAAGGVGYLLAVERLRVGYHHDVEVHRWLARLDGVVEVGLHYLGLELIPLVAGFVL